MILIMGSRHDQQVAFSEIKLQLLISEWAVLILLDFSETVKIKIVTMTLEIALFLILLAL